MNVNMNISGLKCDNPKCDFKDPYIPFSEYAKYVNARCPQCGAILLTERDYKKCLKIMNFVQGVSTLSHCKQNNSEQAHMKVTLDMNGTGDVKITSVDTKMV